MKHLLALAVLAVVLVACGDSRVSVNPQTLPVASVGQAYDVPVTGDDGRGQAALILDVSLAAGSLPPGMATYNPPGNGTGHGGIKGVPTLAGTYRFTIGVGGFCTMGGCVRGSRDYTLVVNP